MIRQCCVCKRVHDDGRWVAPEPEVLDTEEITHGYCDECSKDFLKSVAEYIAASQMDLSLASNL